MHSPFIELNVVVDSDCASGGNWTALVRRDQILSVEDLSMAHIAGNPKARVLLAEPTDVVEIADTGGAVVHGRRELYVKQDLAMIDAFLKVAPDSCGGCCE